MWGSHFEQLYNSIQDEQSKQYFYESLDNCHGTGRLSICIRDLITCVSKQKTGKSVALDNIAMEAYIIIWWYKVISTSVFSV